MRTFSHYNIPLFIFTVSAIFTTQESLAKLKTSWDFQTSESFHYQKYCSYDGSAKTSTLKLGYDSNFCLIEESMSGSVEEGTLISSDSFIVDAESPNSPPTIEISSPLNGAIYEGGDVILLKGVATDIEEGDLSNNISWRSNLDGVVSNMTTLSVGDHIVTALVTDSMGLTATRSIYITVQPSSSANSSVTIYWALPSNREDGTALLAEEISGFEIHFQSDLDGSHYAFKIDDHTATSYEVTDLLPDSYTMTMRTFDSIGLVSEPSPPIQVVIGGN